LAWNQESYDAGAFHDNATNNTRLTVPSGKAGKYWCYAKVRFAANATGRRRIEIWKNGSAAISRKYMPANGTDIVHIDIFEEVDLIATDYLEVRVEQNSGGSLNVDAGTEDTYFIMRRSPGL
jgi:hypothetical protein